MLQLPGILQLFSRKSTSTKVYGDKPSNFQVMGSASLGVEAGSDASIAIAGETLFYLARTGIVAYSGGIPQQVGAAFGTQRFRNAVGGSDGTEVLRLDEGHGGRLASFCV